MKKLETEGNTTVIASALPINLQIGGTESTILQAIRIANNSSRNPNSRRLIVIAPNTRPYETGLVSVKTTDFTYTMPFDLWFSERWSQVFPDAHSSVACSPELLKKKKMYKGEYSTEPGTLARIIEHSKKYSPLLEDPDIDKRFVERYRDFFLNGVPDGATINWHNFVMVPLINEFSDILREKDCIQYFIDQLSVSPYLPELPFGQEYLRAISKVDTIFTHTDMFASRVRRNLESSGLRIPAIKRMDLGPDTEFFEHMGKEINQSNYKTREDYAQLSKSQQDVLDEIMRTRGEIPHRFLCLDRVDPTKGMVTLVEGIELYLDSLHKSNEELRDEYRFFFVAPQIESNPENISLFNLRRGNLEMVQEKYGRLKQSYPDLFYVCDGLPRQYIPAVMDDMHMMSGGAEEATNRSITEGLFVNATNRRNRSAVFGSGIALSHKFSPNELQCVFIANRGSRSSIASKLKSLIDLENQNPYELGRRIMVIRDYVLRQTSTALAP